MKGRTGRAVLPSFRPCCGPGDPAAVPSTGTTDDLSEVCRSSRIGPVGGEDSEREGTCLRVAGLISNLASEGFRAPGQKKVSPRQSFSGRSSWRGWGGRWSIAATSRRRSWMASFWTSACWVKG